MAEGARLRAGIAEGHLAWIRLGIISFNVAVYLWWLPHGSTHALAVAISAIALVYALAVVALRPHERLPVMRTAWFTLSTDSVLIAFWLYATGGLDSPFVFLWFLSLMAVVYRFGPPIVLLASGLYVAGDLGMLVASGTLLGHGTAASVRVAYIVAAGALGALLTASWSRAIQEKADMVATVVQHQRDLQETDRLRALADATFEAILIHKDGVVLEANEAAGRMFARPRDQLIGMHALDLVADASRDRVASRLDEPDDAPYEIWFDRMHERRRAAVQARDMEFHGERVRVVALRDITEEYEARRARELAVEQGAEIRRLQEVDRFRRRFVNTAAHELNTPLTPIRLQVMLLKRRFGKEGFEILERNVERLGALVQDLLDAAKLEDHRLRMHREAEDVALVARQAVESFQPSARQRGIRMEMEADGQAIADIDRHRMAQVFHNLISNALKFTPPEGLVRIRVRCETDVRITVSDTGPGIPPGHKDKLFQPFGMLHDDPSIPGTGLGLYICRQLVEAMDGEIDVDEGPGATFHIVLPSMMVPLVS